MKKFITVLLALSMVFSLAACAQDTTASDTTVSTETTVQPGEVTTTQPDTSEEVKDVEDNEESADTETTAPEATTEPEVSEEPETSEDPEETESDENAASLNVGDQLFNLFAELAADTSLSAEDIANQLMASEYIPFSPAVMPIEPGMLMGLGEASIEGFLEGAMFGPMIGTIPFIGYIFTLEDDTDQDDFLAVLNDNYDLRWNICTEAELMISGSYEDKVFFLMCPRSLSE